MSRRKQETDQNCEAYYSAVAMVRLALGDTAFSTSWAHGHAMTTDEAVEMFVPLSSYTKNEAANRA